MHLLKGKIGLIMGVANNMSIAWAIADECSKHGAALIFTYQSEILKKRVQPLADSVNSKLVLECDATNEESLDALFSKIKEQYGKIDFIIHAIAYSDKNELRGRCVDTTSENFLNAMNISVFTLLSISKRAAELMTSGGSILTLSYYGAEKVMPNYNVMGICKAALECSVKYIANDLGPENIRVNAISAGPIKTLAASVIGGFNNILKINEGVAPLRRNVTQKDVANTAVYLFSDLSSAVTAEVIHVDAGYNSIGMFTTADKENS
jgi:enoyl-[acyl-carrier protein] reductase I